MDENEGDAHFNAPGFDAAYRQTLPFQGEVDILPLVVKDLEDRSSAGAKKYGTVLQSKNGRDALFDAYQECLDMAMYLRQAIEERRKP